MSKEEERERINPAARRDEPGEEHDDLTDSGGGEEEQPHPRPYQKGTMRPHDHGGIVE